VDRKSFYQFVSPSIVIMGLLMALPLAMALWLGFNYLTYRNINDPQFIGLENYTEVLGDPDFWASLRFTLLLIAITVPAQMLIGFIVALLLDQVARWARDIYMAGMLLPFVVVPIVGSLMFRQLFVPSGLGAWAYRELIGERFIFSEASVKALIIVHAIWYNTPFPLIVFFAGLQTLPQDLVEASSIDGANRLGQIWYVVLPHLRSLIILVAMISIMDMYRVFDSVIVFTQQNPIYNADSLMTYTFRVAVTVQQLGKANAMAIMTVIGVLVVLFPFLYRTYRDQLAER
jgi:ABC-type sugar transport system permease subunit